MQALGRGGSGLAAAPPRSGGIGPCGHAVTGRWLSPLTICAVLCATVLSWTHFLSPPRDPVSARLDHRPSSKATTQAVARKVSVSLDGLTDADASAQSRPQNSAAAAGPDPINRVWPPYPLFERYEAIADLGDFRGPVAELALVSLLYDEHPGIREAAVESLGSLNSAGATQGLSYALTDVDVRVRSTAIDMLVELGSPDSINALAITLSDPETDVRLTAVSELADIDSLAAATILQSFLADSDSLVREIAAEALDGAPY